MGVELQRRSFLGWILLVALLPLAGCTASDGPGDGLVSDGAVQRSAAALSEPPEATGCTSAVASGRQYWFCATNRSWATSRQRCQAVSLDLASVESGSENALIAQHVDDDAWIGGTDVVEGTWRWVNTNVQFWQGTSSGSAVGGAYANWSSLQPSSASQDCALLDESSAKWSDETCSDSRDYVCEGPLDLCELDPNKDAPGQCGCGIPDTDSDADGTADCNDECDADPAKVAAGQCGCGSPDTDTDGDGTADCQDGCDEDPAHTVPDCTPDSSCTRLVFGASAYWFCDGHRQWTDARDRCIAAGYRLARIDSATENTFIRQQILTDRWVGGSDTVQEGVWRWEIGGDQFWQGTSSGSAVGGLYENWTFAQPSNSGFGSGEDCLQIQGDGDWLDDECSDTEQYICEDLCPNDVTKSLPGECGCGVSDADTDGDGALDCLEECDNDPGKLDAGVCGCGALDRDRDGDGPLDCEDACADDSVKQEPGACGCGRPDTDSDLDGSPDCVPCSGAQVDAAWPMSGFCRGGGRRSPFVGPIAGDELWSVVLPVTSVFAPTLGPGNVAYVGLSDGLRAIGPTGTSLWHYTTTGPVRTSPALGSGGVLYFGADDGYLRAVRATDGQLEWSTNVGAPIRSSPTLGVDGTVYFGADDGRVVAVEPAAGAILWTYATGGAVVTPAVVSRNGVVIAASTAGSVHALRPDVELGANERAIWTSALGSAINAGTALSDRGSALYVGTEAGRFAKLLIEDGSVAWEVQSTAPIRAAPTVGAFGLVFFANLDGDVRMLEDRGSSVVSHWTQDLGGPVVHDLISGADGTVYATASDIFALAPGGVDVDRVIGNLAIGTVFSSPAIRSDGLVTVVSSGRLRALGNLFLECQGSTRCGSFMGVNYCGYRMPGSPHLLPPPCPSDGDCGIGATCHDLFGYRFCHHPCNHLVGSP